MADASKEATLPG